MNTSHDAAPAGAECEHDHLVEFYETDDFLVSTVTDFMLPALRGRDAAIIVATAEHRAAFDGALAAHGIDLDGAARDGRYQVFDAAELLTLFMRDGEPDPERFRHCVDAVIDTAAAGGREVRVYGEMVALLWADGDVTSTIALEDLWNDLAAVRSFHLLCAYPLQGFDDSARAAFRRICEQHTAVIPPDFEVHEAGRSDQDRIVADLRRETAALRAELERLRAAQSAAVSGWGSAELER